MTREEVENMPFPELKKAVAIHVLGQAPEHELTDWEPSDFGIADVVWKMRERGWDYFGLEWDQNNRFVARFERQVYDEDNVFRFEYGFFGSDFPDDAVYRAALQAVFWGKG